MTTEIKEQFLRFWRIRRSLLFIFLGDQNSRFFFIRDDENWYGLQFLIVIFDFRSYIEFEITKNIYFIERKPYIQTWHRIPIQVTYLFRCISFKDIQNTFRYLIIHLIECRTARIDTFDRFE